MTPLFTAERGLIGVGGLILFVLAESVWPFKQPVDSRWRRYAINLFIASSNALLLSVLLGGLIVATYHSFELHRVGWYIGDHIDVAAQQTCPRGSQGIEWSN